MSTHDGLRSPTGSFVRLILDPTALPIDLRGFVVERDSTGVRTLQRDLLMTRDIELRVAYSMARPSTEMVQTYVDTFGIESEHLVCTPGPRPGRRDSAPRKPPSPSARTS